jgi:hypothetical protein
VGAGESPTTGSWGFRDYCELPAILAGLLAAAASTGL